MQVFKIVLIAFPTVFHCLTRVRFCLSLFYLAIINGCQCDNALQEESLTIQKLTIVFHCFTSVYKCFTCIYNCFSTLLQVFAPVLQVFKIA